jgi:hypothetical protein
MRLTLYSSLFFGLLMANLNADIIVDAVPTAAGPDLIHYTFTLSGFNLLQYQALDLKFDSSTYSSLSDALAPANFSTMIFQPGIPPGAPGDFLVEALISNPALTPGSIGIDATLVPGHGALGPLPFFVYQFDGSGPNAALVGDAVFSGMTTVPEPAGVSLPVLGLLIAGILGSRWRNRVNPLNRGCRS